jgi:hypothetical protein
MLSIFMALANSLASKGALPDLLLSFVRELGAKRKICAPPIIPFAANQIMFDLPTSDRQRMPEGEAPIYETQGI